MNIHSAVVMKRYVAFLFVAENLSEGLKWYDIK
ncbi:Protein of unknown function [Bacillus mycoides]|nr:Protein of unknown function [Bacillus mycoides]